MPARTLLRAGFTLAAAVLVGALLVGGFIVSGAYNIGADDHHTAVVLALISELRDRSIAVRSGVLAVPELADAASVAAGARRYQELCVGCHLAPGLGHSQLRAGLYPHPPNLAQQASGDPRREFWVIKHGIKMSAMPAWGRTLDDAAIWQLVAFAQQLPQMSPQNYARLTR